MKLCLLYMYHIVEPRGLSVRCVWVLVNKLNLYNLVAVYTIGSMAGLITKALVLSKG
jgi:hypothetical protein